MPKDKRYYITFTVEFPHHPKIAILSDKAFRCLHEAIAHSRELQTDGFLARRYALGRWGAETLAELCSNDDENPSLIEDAKGWKIHDYAEHQDTKDVVETRATRRKEAGQKGGNAKAANRAASSPVANASKDVANASKGARDPVSNDVAPPCQSVASVAVTTTVATSSPVSGNRYQGNARADETPDESFLAVFDTDDTFDLATSPKGQKLSAPASGNASRIVKKHVPRRRLSGNEYSGLIILVADVAAEHGFEFAEQCVIDWVKTDKGLAWFKKVIVEDAVARRYHSETNNGRPANGHRVATSDRIVSEIDALRDKPRTRSSPLYMKELTNGS